MKGVMGIFCLIAAGAAGCHEPITPSEPTRSRVHAPGEAEFDRLWVATLAVLRSHDFRPGRRDRRAGVIETLPTTAQHFFEFWRKDTVGAYERAEANLHTLRKFVTVRLSKTDRRGWYDLDVEVQVERLSQPERQITSASGALRAFSEAVPTQQGVFPGEPAWNPLGRDGKLEAVLLERILTRYGEPLWLEQEAGDSKQVSMNAETARSPSGRPASGARWR